ncbi:MAG TPA: serine hydrolase, partial [Membranihabitans sp.]|nr:serine hydrolase [Membranihabitans sp.]
DRLFHPLGAHHTAFNPAGSYPIHQIIPTEVDQVWRKQLVHGGVHDEAAAVLQGLSTNAGLFSSAQDLIKLGETWRRKGQFGGQQFWSPETIETFTRCYYCDEGNRRGLGFDRPPLPEHDYLSYMSPLASHESFGHSGFTGTMMWVDPAEEYTFVFLSNRVHPSRENTKLYSLNIRPDLHGVLYKTLEKSRRP